MNKDKILEKLKKLQALVDRGVGGEKENAREMLERMMKKHGISFEELMEDKVEWFAAKYNTSLEKELLLQLIGIVTKTSEIEFKEVKSEKLVGIEVNKIQEIQLRELYDFYLPLFREEYNSFRKTFASAFIHKHQLYPPKDKTGEGRKLSEEELAKVLGLTQGMKDKIFRKIIE